MRRSEVRSLSVTTSETTARDAVLHFRMTDTGVGVAKDQADRLFGMLQQQYPGSTAAQSCSAPAKGTSTGPEPAASSPTTTPTSHGT